MDIPSYFWSKYMNHCDNAATKYTARPCADKGCRLFDSFGRFHEAAERVASFLAATEPAVEAKASPIRAFVTARRPRPPQHQGRTHAVSSLPSGVLPSPPACLRMADCCGLMDWARRRRLLYLAGIARAGADGRRRRSGGRGRGRRSRRGRARAPPASAAARRPPRALSHGHSLPDPEMSRNIPQYPERPKPPLML